MLRSILLAVLFIVGLFLMVGRWEERDYVRACNSLASSPVMIACYRVETAVRNAFGYFQPDR